MTKKQSGSVHRPEAQVARKLLAEYYAKNIKKVGAPQPGYGATWGISSNEKIRFGQTAQEGVYYVQHEWAVNEAHDDDHLSVTGTLFPGEPCHGYRLEGTREEIENLALHDLSR